MYVYFVFVFQRFEPIYFCFSVLVISSNLFFLFCVPFSISLCLSLSNSYCWCECVFPHSNLYDQNKLDEFIYVNPSKMCWVWNSSFNLFTTTIHNTRMLAGYYAKKGRIFCECGQSVQFINMRMRWSDWCLELYMYIVNCFLFSLQSTNVSCCLSSHFMPKQNIIIKQKKEEKYKIKVLTHSSTSPTQTYRYRFMAPYVINEHTKKNKYSINGDVRTDL